MQNSSMYKFIVVGVAATLIHIVVASCLIEFYSVQSAGMANSIAFVIATVFSYVGNTKWSFAKKFSRRNAARFSVVATAGSLIAYMLSSTVQALGFHYFLGIALVVVCLPILSFMAHSYWTYRND